MRLNHRDMVFAKHDGRIAIAPPVAGEISHCVRVQAGRGVSPYTIERRRTSPRQSRQVQLSGYMHLLHFRPEKGISGHWWQNAPSWSARYYIAMTQGSGYQEIILSFLSKHRLLWYRRRCGGRWTHWFQNFRRWHICSSSRS